MLQLALALQALSIPPGLPAPCVGTFQATAERECPRFVFFDSGESEFRRDWERELDAIAARLQALPGSRLLLIGRSDASGPAGANLRISRARATLVRDALVARGVPLDRIDLQATGENDLLVPTADGVREGQNRRVDMFLILSR